MGGVVLSHKPAAETERDTRSAPRGHRRSSPPRETPCRWQETCAHTHVRRKGLFKVFTQLRKVDEGAYSNKYMGEFPQSIFLHAASCCCCNLLSMYLNRNRINFPQLREDCESVKGRTVRPQCRGECQHTETHTDTAQSTRRRRRRRRRECRSQATRSRAHRPLIQLHETTDGTPN